VRGDLAKARQRNFFSANSGILLLIIGSGRVMVAVDGARHGDDE
jgi:hypothetical protein